jgi:hypothetical protein
MTKRDQKQVSPDTAAKAPTKKASGRSNAPRPDVDDTKRRQEPGSKGQGERSPRQENL